MCWEKEDEIYNEGGAFKVTCRDASGVVVTLIADNYYGYCKKEVKTQISYATNLMGNGEEEHAGGTLANASYNLGDTFRANSRRHNGRTFEDVAKDMPDRMTVMPEGYGIDRQFPQVVYVPGDAVATVGDLSIRWSATTRHRAPHRPRTRQALPRPQRLPLPHGQAPRRPQLAAGRHRRRGLAVPQALHRLGRRQKRDQQVPARLHALRPHLRRRSGSRPGPLPSHLRP